MTQIIHTLDAIADRYDVAFVDLWGCLHDGYRPIWPAVEALRRFKARGGTVLLLTNSPRPRAAVERQLAKIGVPRDCWDVMATSGDAARYAMWTGAVGRKVWHIGLPAEYSFFEPMKLLPDAPPIERVPLEEAEGIVCTGPFDATQPPEVYRPQFLLAKTRGLKLLCANPDIVVDRGNRREWCAGALAKLYEEMGGESLYFGKPHPPIYDLAMRRLDEIGVTADRARILCIGDGIETDIRGAMGEDLDALFITGGLAAEETGTPPGGDPDPERLAAFLAAHGLDPQYSIGQLR